MKEKYKGKINVPFCVKCSGNYREELASLLSEIVGYDVNLSGCWDYYGIDHNNTYDYWQSIRYFGNNTTVYTIEELQAIVDEVNTSVVIETNNTVDSDGWIEWNGGEMPVPENVVVQLKFDNGSMGVGTACNYCWYHSSYCHDIIAYRVLNVPVASCSDDTTTLEESKYVGIGSGETISNGSVGSSVGVKYDKGKAQWRLLPWKSLKEIVEVLTFGASKYSPDNWQKVDPDRYKDAALRHFAAWLDGEKDDPETGKSHLAHLGCCVLFLLWFEVTGKLNG